MAIELSIRVSGTEKSYTHKQVLYMKDEEVISLSYEDDVLKDLREQSVKEFKKICPEEEPEDVVFRIKMIWK